MFGLMTRPSMIQSQQVNRSSTSHGAYLACLSIAVVVGIAGAARNASAQSLADCGDIRVEAEAMCTVIPPSAQCEAMCTPVSVRAACSAQLAAQCDARCNELPSVSCTGECYAECDAECTVDPGRFDCEAACNVDCGARCEANCSASDSGAGCMAECMGACGVSCQQSCDVELPSADCRGKCEAGCNGSCTVETNLDCQVDCQAEGYVDCQAELTGGCKAQCETRDGALFCNGQYVDHGDNLQMCIDALQAILDAHVEASSSGEADCEGGRCEASGEASVSTDCSSTPAGGPTNPWGLLSLAGAMLAFAFRRRR